MEEEEDAQVLLEEVNDKDLKVGDNVEIEIVPKNFGRIAAQTAKQVIIQKLREAERDIIYLNATLKVKALGVITLNIRL